MNKSISARLELLEAIEQDKRQRREEANRRLAFHLKGNVGTIWHGGKKYTVTGEGVFAAVLGVENFILQAKPETVVYSAELSGILDLLPGLEEIDEMRKLDTWFTVPIGSFSGDYYTLLASNEGISLSKIMLCNISYIYCRGCKADEDRGVDIFFDKPPLHLADNPLAIIKILRDRVAKFKAYKEAYEKDPVKHRFTVKPWLPSNTYSRYWPDKSTKEELTALTL